MSGTCVGVSSRATRHWAAKVIGWHSHGRQGAVHLQLVLHACTQQNWNQRLRQAPATRTRTLGSSNTCQPNNTPCRRPPPPLPCATARAPPAPRTRTAAAIPASLHEPHKYSLSQASTASALRHGSGTSCSSHSHTEQSRSEHMPSSGHSGHSQYRSTCLGVEECVTQPQTSCRPGS